MKFKRSFATVGASSSQINRTQQSFDQFRHTLHQAFVSIKSLHIALPFRTSSMSTPGPTSINKKRIKTVIPLILLVLAVFAFLFISIRNVTKGNVVVDQRASIKDARATLNLNKEFSFPLKDDKGKEITKLKFTIDQAELRDEIIVKGNRAVAIKGRTFLILSIKLINDFDKTIDLNARDYVRLSVNGNEKELLAADIHNDPVSIQPISTKYTRLGFPINDTDKNIALLIGEIKGKKETVALNFK